MHGIRMWTQVSFVLSQSVRLTDRQTDIYAFAISCVALQSHRKKLNLAGGVTRGAGSVLKLEVTGS